MAASKIKIPSSAQAVILAGGLGTRLGEETSLRPKPMVEVGGMPILWHIMKIYSYYGVKNFIICLGYKGYLIKEYFANYFLHSADVTLNLANNSMEVLRNRNEAWTITLVDTGQSAMTGGRLKAVRQYLTSEQPFFFTYGDGVTDLNISDLYSFHLEHKAKVTVTAVAPPGRFGALEFEKDKVVGFREKPAGDGGLINGGFFVADPSVLDHYIEDEQTVWEKDPMERLARDGEMCAFKHTGFWQPMDTLRDKIFLENLWESGAPWKCW